MAFFALEFRIQIINTAKLELDVELSWEGEELHYFSSH